MKARLRTQVATPHISVCLAAVISVALMPSMVMAQSGDMNCDGAVNTTDIPMFVDALLATGSFGGCDINRADMNADTLINARDTQPFVAALLHPCPPGLTFCSGQCAYLPEDPQNCGSCGNVCLVGTSCLGGACQPNDPCTPDHPYYPNC